MSIRDVWAIIATYNSEPSRIDAQLERLQGECRIAIVDNSTEPQARNKLEELSHKHNAKYICMRGNVGIAQAQNQGAAYAIANGARFLLLLDDDSLPVRGMIASLHSTYDSRLKHGCRAVVCGMHLERGAPPQISGQEIRPIINMMSSGTFISTDIFTDVGAMDEDLFIDYVDFDWGWRAQKKGYTILLDPSTTFEHSLGEGNKKFLSITIRVPAPIRHYFQFRNTFLLAHRPHVPLSWKLGRFLITPAKLFILLMVAKNRRERIYFAAKGALHGIRRRSGPYTSAKS